MDNKLTHFHITILVFMTQTGIVMFRLPQLLAENIGTNGWLAIFIVSLAVLLSILLIGLAYKLGRGEAPLSILENTFPIWLLAPFYLLISFVFGFIGTIVAIQYTLIFQKLAFPSINPKVFVVVIQLVALYLVIQGIYNISKAATFFFGLVAWLLFLLLYTLKDFQWIRLSPYIFKGAEGNLWFKSFFAIYPAFAGYFISIFLIQYANRKSKVIQSTIYGHIISTIIYAMIGILAFGFYGTEMLKQMRFPLLNLMAMIQLPFVQAIENLFYSFFLFTTIITIVMYYWVAVEASKRVFKVNAKIIAVALVVSMFFVTIKINTFSSVEELSMLITVFEAGITFSIPVITIICILIQKGSQSNENRTNS